MRLDPHGLRRRARRWRSSLEPPPRDSGCVCCSRPSPFRGCGVVKSAENVAPVVLPDSDPRSQMTLERNP